MTKFRCPDPACGTESLVPDRFAGHRVGCRSCGTEFLVPGLKGAFSAAKPGPVPPRPVTVVARRKKIRFGVAPRGGCRRGKEYGARRRPAAATPNSTTAGTVPCGSRRGHFKPSP
jgi:hypothetical protein